MVNSKTGFGLIEIIFAMGLLGVLSIGVLKIIELQTNTNRSADQDQVITSAVNEINALLANPAACAMTLKGRLPDLEPYDPLANNPYRMRIGSASILAAQDALGKLEIKDSLGNVQFSASPGRSELSSRVKITDIQFAFREDTGIPTQIGQYVLRVLVTFDKGNVKLGVPRKTVTLNVRARLGNNFLVEDCAGYDKELVDERLCELEKQLIHKRGGGVTKSCPQPVEIKMEQTSIAFDCSSPYVVSSDGSKCVLRYEVPTSFSPQTVQIQLLGAGGGGGGGSSARSGNGGKAGEYKELPYWLAPTYVCIMEIGKGGTGGYNHDRGNSGGNTLIRCGVTDAQVSQLEVANGGIGGDGSTGGTSDLNGHESNSLIGGGPGGRGYEKNHNGDNAQYPGAGGGAAGENKHTGGRGGDGRIVWTFMK